MTAGTAVLFPAALAGVWTLIDDGGCDNARGLEFSRHMASIRAASPVSCRYLGLRAIHARRWYVDMTCGDGAIVELDVNLRDPDTIIVAPRPLGEAQVYRRCGLS